MAELENNAPVEVLIGLQKLADDIDDPFKKIDYVKRTLLTLGAHAMLDHKFLVSSNLVFATNEDAAPKEMLKFDEGMFFIGSFNAYSYMLDPDLPIDSLALNFLKPEVIGTLPEEANAFNRLRFRVPVLAIESCVSAETA